MSIAKVFSIVAFAIAGFSSAAMAHDTLSDIGGSLDRGAVNNITGSGGLLNTALPWVRKYYSPAGQCLHFEITQVDPPADLKMVVIAPRADTRYRDDDSGSLCTNCPRVNIPVTPERGFYTVVVNHFAGGSVNSSFLLSFSRAAANAPVCSPATTDIITR
jgi:hypothetical protein